MAMRTFTFSDAKSHKFWNIELKGNTFTVVYGRIGSAGQTQEKMFATPEKAQAEHDKLIREKTGKGYVETTEGSTSPGTTAVKSTREILEAALIKNPEDVTTYRAYADLLMEENDPLGELAQVQIQLEDANLSAKERKPLTTREASLLADHQATWLGPMAQYLIDQHGRGDYSKQNGDLFSFRWERGWITTLRIPGLDLRTGMMLFASPMLRMLRELTIDSENGYEDGYEEAGETTPEGLVPEDMDEDAIPFIPLYKASFLNGLRKFQFGVTEEMYYTDSYCGYNYHAGYERISDLVARMPNLEELRLLCRGVDAKKLFASKTLSKLRIIQLFHGVDYPLERMASNPVFSNLTHLYCHPHAAEDGPILTLASLRALCQSKVLNNLQFVQVRCCDAGDDGIEEILKSGVLKRWTGLDLRHGRITDAGVDEMVKSPDIKHLTFLDLSFNRLTAPSITKLEALKIPTLLTYNQYSTDGTNGEPDEYLYAWDIE